MKKDIKKRKNNVGYSWIFKITFLAFIISISFTFISETAIPNVNLIFGIILVSIFVALGIIFDMVGVSVTASDESKFHSMAAQKVKGAKMAVKLKKNADKVSSFCNDVVGDISGIVSGSTGAVIAIRMSQTFNINPLLVTLITMAIISTITITGKAIGKGIALNKSNHILFRFARIISIFNKD